MPEFAISSALVAPLDAKAAGRADGVSVLALYCPWYTRAMAESTLEEMKRYVGFTAEDAARVHALAETVVPCIPKVVERFYQQLLLHESAREVFTGGEAQMAHQRSLLSAWLNDVFTTAYDADYYDRRLRIGIAHVRAGLPQRYMLLGMEIIWQALRDCLIVAGVPDVLDNLLSLHKLLTIELAIMLESYKEGYSAEVRQAERSLVKEKLTRAEHLAGIGQLAASLAHEIKNPLAGISGAIQIIRGGMERNNPHGPILDEILRQIDRLDATVKDLLLYAKPSAPRFTRFVVDDAVRRVLTVLGEEPAMQKVRVELDNGTPDLDMLADEAQIEQLLINLVLNAAHACDGGGLVRVSVHGDTEHVRLNIADNGKGMPDEVQVRAFEPFFTTKAKGTGLGLSICRRIVETHGGSVHMTSAVGKGTTVTIELPRRIPAPATSVT